MIFIKFKMGKKKKNKKKVKEVKG
jgi:hypothetical protein